MRFKNSFLHHNQPQNHLIQNRTSLNWFWGQVITETSHFRTSCGLFVQWNVQCSANSSLKMCHLKLLIYLIHALLTSILVHSFIFSRPLFSLYHLVSPQPSRQLAHSLFSSLFPFLSCPQLIAWKKRTNIKSVFSSCLVQRVCVRVRVCVCVCVCVYVLEGTVVRCLRILENRISWGVPLQSANLQCKTHESTRKHNNSAVIPTTCSNELKEMSSPRWALQMFCHFSVLILRENLWNGMVHPKMLWAFTYVMNTKGDIFKCWLLFFMHKRGLKISCFKKLVNAP